MADEAEKLRILRAIRDGKLYMRPSGRYAIEADEPPDRRVREHLIRRELVTWAFDSRGLKLTDAGRTHLRALEGGPS